MDLSGTVALVTGGNGGLGQRICHKLASEGVHVAVMYAQGGFTALFEVLAVGGALVAVGALIFPYRGDEIETLRAIPAASPAE